MLVKLFQNTILSNALCSSKDRILAAVSGGKDSMALVHLLLEAGYYFEVAHVNFKLRGQASEDDETLVRNFCHQHNIVFHTCFFETKKYAKDLGISTQMAARELRYNWFNSLLDNHKLDHLATAHHLNDRLETLLLNITKGSGPKGLTAIPIKTHRIIRPMLNISSEQIAEYLSENNIQWREDQSNKKDDYQRNRIRNQVIPQLKEINPGLEKTNLINFDRFNALNAIFQDQLSQFSKHLKIQENSIKISLDLLETTAGISLILEEYLKPFGFNFQDVKTLLKTSETGKSLFSSSHILILERSNWSLNSLSEDKIETAITIEKTGLYSLPNSDLLLDIEFASRDEVTFDNPSVTFFDADKIKWPLKIRSWADGDRFKPFGMKGSKLVSDYLKDSKIEHNEKKKQLILEDSGEIVWVLSLSTSESYKIKSSTKNILSMKLRNK